MVGLSVPPGESHAGVLVRRAVVMGGLELACCSADLATADPSACKLEAPKLFGRRGSLAPVVPRHRDPQVDADLLTLLVVVDDFEERTDVLGKAVPPQIDERRLSGSCDEDVVVGDDRTYAIEVSLRDRFQQGTDDLDSHAVHVKRSEDRPFRTPCACPSNR